MFPAVFVFFHVKTLWVCPHFIPLNYSNIPSALLLVYSSMYMQVKRHTGDGKLKVQCVKYGHNFQLNGTKQQ